jgi:hypothetical protein
VITQLGCILANTLRSYLWEYREGRIEGLEESESGHYMIKDYCEIPDYSLSLGQELL